MWCVFSRKDAFLRFVLRLFPTFLDYIWAVVAVVKKHLRQLRRKEEKHCAVFGCNNSYYDDKGLFAGYHFFSFPTDPKRRNRWCNLIKRQHGKDGFTVTGATVVCHEHFRQDDIAKKLSGRWDLKKGFWKTCKLHVANWYSLATAFKSLLALLVFLSFPNLI